MEKPKVSIMVPAHNSRAPLADCLKSVSARYSSFEIAVVYGCSIDTTTAITAQYEARIIRQKSTAALARNIGIANSTGKYVFFIDSDQVLSVSVVEGCVKNSEDGNAGKVRVPEVLAEEGIWGSCSAEWRNSCGKVGQECGASGSILAGES